MTTKSQQINKRTAVIQLWLIQFIHLTTWLLKQKKSSQFPFVINIFCIGLFDLCIMYGIHLVYSWELHKKYRSTISTHIALRIISLSFIINAKMSNDCRAIVYTFTLQASHKYKPSWHTKFSNIFKIYYIRRRVGVGI